MAEENETHVEILAHLMSTSPEKNLAYYRGEENIQRTTDGSCTV